MDKFVADRAAGPSAAEKSLIAIQALVADLTVPGLNPQQHRLPIATGFSDAHSGRSIAGLSAQIQEGRIIKRGDGWGLYLVFR